MRDCAMVKSHCPVFRRFFRLNGFGSDENMSALVGVESDARGNGAIGTSAMGDCLCRVIWPQRILPRLSKDMTEVRGCVREVILIAPHTPRREQLAWHFRVTGQYRRRQRFRGETRRIGLRVLRSFDRRTGAELGRIQRLVRNWQSIRPGGQLQIICLAAVLP